MFFMLLWQIRDLFCGDLPQKNQKQKDEKKQTNKQTEPTKQKSLEILET